MQVLTMHITPSQNWVHHTVVIPWWAIMGRKYKQNKAQTLCETPIHSCLFLIYGCDSIDHIVLQMTSSDKDFRFMATNDLMAELQKDSIKLDDDSERKVVKMLLKLLEDKNGEVQNLAVKW